MKKLFLASLLLTFSFGLQAQNTNVSGFVVKRLQKEKTGMLVLGGWAIGNIALGAGLAGRREGEDRYFHIMNAGWNTVNLTLATLGYLNAVNADPAAFDLASATAAQYNIEKILLLNTGLDVGYMLGGLYLMERSRNTDKKPERLKGFGKSIMLQGGFLFVFDLASYFAHANTRSDEWRQLLSSLYFDGNSVGLLWQF